MSMPGPVSEDRQLTSTITDIKPLIDHRGTMALIDGLVAVHEGSAHCIATVRADNPFLVNGRLPAWILVEYLAQSVAVFVGHLRSVEHAPHRHGLLLGCRNLRLADVALNVGDRLELFVEEIIRLDEFGRFSGIARLGENEVASGLLLLYECIDWPGATTSIPEPERPAG